MKNEHRYVIVHRSSGLRKWLRAALFESGGKVVGMSATIEDGFRSACLLKPDLILVELDASESGEYPGIGLVQDIQQQLPVQAIYITRGLGPKMLDAARPTRPLGFLNRPLRARDLLGVLEVCREWHYAPPVAQTPIQVCEPSGNSPIDGLHARLRGILDCLTVGVIIVHRDLRFEHANLMGWRILRKGSIFALRNGCLSMTDADQERRLSELVRRARCDSMTLDGSANNAAGLRILLCPIPTAETETGAMAVYLIDPSERMQEVELQLQRLYHLTRAESRVVRALMMWPSRAEVAGQLFLSEHTVGTHLQNIYGKLGVHNQHELIHCVFTGPAGNLLRVGDHLLPR